MKIVATSNFDLDTYTETVVAENIKIEEFAKVMCKSLNDKYCGEHAYDYYRVYPDDYKLNKWEP